jgi:hypothetical protein
MKTWKQKKKKEFCLYHIITHKNFTWTNNRSNLLKKICTFKCLSLYLMFYTQMTVVYFFCRSCKCNRSIFETSGGLGNRSSEKDWPRAFWYWQGGWPGDLDMVPGSADSW